MLAAIMCMRLSHIDTDEIQLPMTHAFFGNDLLSKLPNCFCRPLQRDGFEAFVMVQMHMHRRDRQFVVGML